VLSVFKTIASHADQIIIPRISGDGKVEIAMMPYTKDRGTKNAYITLRLPTESRRNGESLMATAIRGVREEAAKDPSDFDIEVWGMCYAEFFQDEQDPEGAHVKAAIVIQHVCNQKVCTHLRDFPKVDQDDADEFHDPMEWLEVNEILNALRRRREGKLKLLYSHGVSICAFLRMLSTRLPEVEMYYHNYLEEYKGVRLTPQQHTELERYMAQVK